MDDTYELNLRLVDAGPAGGHATSTNNECGSGNTGTPER